MMTAIKDLPSSLTKALSVFFQMSQGKIRLGAAESFSLQQIANDGCRSVVVLVNLATGETKDFQGTWGSGGYGNNAVDKDTTRRDLPEGFGVISGHTGATHYAEIALHPKNMLSVLPSQADQITSAEAFILKLMSYKASYRREQFAEWDAENEVKADEIVVSLAKRGFIQVSGRGAKRTLAGDNALEGSEWKHVPDNFYGYPSYLERHERTKANEAARARLGEDSDEITPEQISQLNAILAFPVKTKEICLS